MFLCYVGRVYYNLLMAMKERRWRRGLVFGGAVFAAVVAIGIGWYVTTKHQSSPVDELNVSLGAQKSVTPLFFRPAVDRIGGANGYTYMKDSVVVSPALVSFTFSNVAGQTIVVTLQPKPENFDESTYKGRDQLNVATGRAVIGQNTTNTTAAIFSDKTFLFVKAQHIVDDDTLKALLAAFALQ